MTLEHPDKVHLSPEDRKLLHDLRQQRRGRAKPAHKPGLGDRIADKVAATVGSWRFIIAQSAILLLWIVLNVLAIIQHWDPYPFILLNLILSFQAAYTAPIIMMSQNRQADIDRRRAEHDYKVNVKAELEIELLHHKIDMMREQEILRLLNVIQRLSAHLAPEVATAVEGESGAKA